VPTRFTASGWHVLHVGNADDLSALNSAVGQFRSTADQPTLIVLDSLTVHYSDGSKPKSLRANASCSGQTSKFRWIPYARFD